ncbi:hypothetical protein LX32DRAFT_641672 [Colletotrichum zoysiae]|uniref:Secreted protein n=1 Tax=Colletotrichum zoysiae TaxID=1216348 RepID=A0AAD9M2Q1_9PEZI|nr:hypothetical protein LX32DRAFT_641672 [Colletotrichum zoysiae]
MRLGGVLLSPFFFFFFFFLGGSGPSCSWAPCDVMPCADSESRNFDLGKKANHDTRTG